MDTLLILFAVALVACSCGFHTYVWFISIGRSTCKVGLPCIGNPSWLRFMPPLGTLRCSIASPDGCWDGMPVYNPQHCSYRGAQRAYGLQDRGPERKACHGSDFA